ncbi:hypothetical protein A946_01585 [Methylacidiphilum kamchatkense Kam1]|uniref:Uncharacterized protein n=2 Tax=Methylacidiphilum kamchatkense TaxID=431057 RepID=A0ABR4ZYW7_9BACT|nr:hypothetical protein A946_01585 [Methylacidiphilum kamchatkense Kam1]
MKTNHFLQDWLTVPSVDQLFANAAILWPGKKEAAACLLHLLLMPNDLIASFEEHGCNLYTAGFFSRKKPILLRDQ